MKRLGIFPLLLLILLPAHAHATDDPGARKLLDDAAQKNAAGFQTGQSKTRITLKLSNGKEKTWVTLARSARIAGKLKTRVTFLDPAEDRGVELLLLEESKGKVAQYLWMPKTHRLRPVGGSQKNAPFMGTDFSFGDLESHALQTGEARKLGNEPMQGAACAHVSIQVTDPDELYSKVDLWIDDKLGVPRKIDYFDKQNKHIKTLSVDEISQDGGHATLKRFHMQNLERGSVTSVETTEMDSKIALPDAIFQPDALGK